MAVSSLNQHLEQVNGHWDWDKGQRAPGSRPRLTSNDRGDRRLPRLQPSIPYSPVCCFFSPMDTKGPIWHQRHVSFALHYVVKKLN